MILSNSSFDFVTLAIVVKTGYTVNNDNQFRVISLIYLVCDFASPLLLYYVKTKKREHHK